MPVQVSYPGVYVEEIPSGVRTITGVATSIAAFVGRARRGPTDKDGPVTINNFGDFERAFGGLWEKSTLGYAVRDFYLNGGSQAVTVRLYKAPDASTDGKSRLTVDNLKLAAASPGDWGQKLRATVDVEVSDEVQTRLGLGKDDALFNLTVRNSGPEGATERFLNLLATNNARRIDRVLKAESNLVGWDGDGPASAVDLPKIKAAREVRKGRCHETERRRRWHHEPRRCGGEAEVTDCYLQAVAFVTVERIPLSYGA